MSRVQLFGSLPGLISENTALWDWVGQLRLTFDPMGIRFVELQGFGANFFDVSLDRRLGVLTVTPIAQADYESFVSANISPIISFSIRFYLTDGTVRDSEATYSVELQNVDDTPPQALSFASGGTVNAGLAGANIGRLLVTDPDTSSGFTYTVLEEDQWIYEVVGGMLKLKAGVSIPLADGPQRPLVVTVSDGMQSAALTVNIGVIATGVNIGGPVDILESHETGAGFRWAAPGNLFSMRMSTELSTIRDFGSLIYIQARDGGAITVEQPAVIDLLDGYIAFSGQSLAGRVWTIYETVFNRDPRHGEMAAGVARLAGGTTQQALVGELLAGAEFATSFGALTNRAFVEMLYRNSVGWMDQNGINSHTSRLDNGVARATVTDGFITWRIDSLKHADQRAGNGGLFVPRSWVDGLDDLTPSAPDSRSQTLWWADQIIFGGLKLTELPQEFLRAQGLLPQLDAGGGASRLERLFSDMTGAPAESNWTRSFTEALQKRGTSSSTYLEQLVKDLDLATQHANSSPTGIAFQAGW